MSVRLRQALMGDLDQLRYEPIDKRIRGVLAGVTVIDSTRAMLVWEPKRVVPSYAFPVADISADISSGTAAGSSSEPDPEVRELGVPRLDGRPVFDPSVPFEVRSSEGETVSLSAGPSLQAAAFRPADDALAGYLIVDFDAFDSWYEEAEENLGHPRDPFHRIDIVHSDRNIVVESGGVVLAKSSTPYLLFEPPLPVRYYLAPEDVRTELLVPSDTTTTCAYKGRASYWSLPDQPDVAWFYPEPLREAAEVTGRVAFFNERVDITVDGILLERPETPWSQRE